MHMNKNILKLCSCVMVSVLLSSSIVTTPIYAVDEPTKVVTTTVAPVATPTVAPRNVISLVKSSAVYGTMNRNNGSFKKGQVVEILMDTGNGTNYQVNSKGTTGWISGYSVNIPESPATNMNKLTKTELEYYVNTKGFISKSNYFSWVDIDRQLLNVFQGSKGKWKLIKSISCSTGTNHTPTKRGFFASYDRGSSFGSYNVLGAKNWVRFSGAYMVHSLPYLHGKVSDYTLGKRASHGCVRISVAESQWYYSLPLGSTIWAN